MEINIAMGVYILGVLAVTLGLLGILWEVTK